MTPIITLTTKLCVVPSGKPIYDEAATTVGLDDEGGGLCDNPARRTISTRTRSRSTRKSGRRSVRP